MLLCTLNIVPILYIFKILFYLETHSFLVFLFVPLWFCSLVDIKKQVFPFRKIQKMYISSKNPNYVDKTIIWPHFRFDIRIKICLISKWETLWISIVTYVWTTTKEKKGKKNIHADVLSEFFKKKLPSFSQIFSLVLLHLFYFCNLFFSECICWPLRR